jgi:hypothetical protein
MKNLNIYYKLLILLFLSIIQTSCKKSPLDNVQVSINTEVLSTPTTIFFENAINQSSVQPTDFTVKISGKDANKVLSAIGNQMFEVQNGFLILNLTKGTLPTSENPIQFIITGNEENFEPIYKEITITNNEDQSIIVKMIESGKLPEGITETKTTTLLDNGKFTSAYTFETPALNGAKQETSFKIESGTTMTDIDGKVIDGNNLEIKARYFDPSTDAIDVIPGGLTPQNVKDINGSPIEGGVQFYSSGLIQIEMKAGEKIVKGFSKPISAEMELKANQENPLTGEPIVAGDSIPLWSRDDISGVWNNEGFAKVVSENGKLTAKFEMLHLSSWNLDHFERATSIFRKLTLNFKTNTWKNPSGNFEILMLTPSNMVLARNNFGAIYNGQKLNLNRVPNIPKIKFRIINKSNNKEVETALIDPKTISMLDIDISKLDIDKSIDISIKYNVKCQQNTKFKPEANAFLIIYDKTDNKKYVFRTGKGIDATQGTLNLSLKEGNKYLIQTTGLDGKLISYESILDRKTLNSVKPVLNGLTVDKLIYNETTNKIEVELTYTTSKC